MNPAARKDGLLVEKISDETLVYDLKRHKAFCLNLTTATVWRQCNGRATVEEIAAQLRTELSGRAEIEPQTALDLARFAIDRLDRARLLEDSGPRAKAEPVLSRRDIARRLARIAGGLAVLVPAVMAVNAPATVVAGSCITADECLRFSSANAGKCCCSNRRKCVGGQCVGDRC